MSVQGTIVQVQLCETPGEPMRVAPTVRAVANLGLEGDSHARQGSKRQVLLMDEETLRAFGLSAGKVRENITTRGIELKTLVPGTQVRMGKALLETTMLCTPCDFIDEIRPGLREQMQGQRGMLARVVEGGEIRAGDAIEVV
jgi:MOSC domain-containing protein YiiM